MHIVLQESAFTVGGFVVGLNHRPLIGLQRGLHNRPNIGRPHDLSDRPRVDHHPDLSDRPHLSRNPTLPHDHYEYKLQNRLAKVTKTITGSTIAEITEYKYNPQGIRVESHSWTELSGTPQGDDVYTDYLIDAYNHTGYAQVFVEDDGTNTTSYVIGDDVLAQATDSADPQYLLYDGHGSTRQLVQSDGTTITDSFSYDAYGVMLGGNPTSAPATSLLYAGEQFDVDAQMYYLRARYYDQNTGRFNRMDPFAGNTQDPQSLHKYLYAHNNPVNGIDPSGKFATASSVAVSVSMMITILVIGVLIAMPLYHRSLRGRATGTCGPKIDSQLDSLWKRLKIIYKDEWGFWERTKNCTRMPSTDGWEISELHHMSLPKGTGDCKETVAVNGNCYSVHEANYFLWGAINKLCPRPLTNIANATSMAWGWSTYGAPVMAWIGGISYEGTAASKVNWTRVGYKYNGNFDLLDPEKSQFSSCTGCASSPPWDGTNFGFKWGYYKGN
ncbi:MAG: RHS repeat-associated core domain-containing protein [Planctomycetota bacterium]|nr:MAG: RHS repeat-associated core domain-containing protein [Planctomycetota bacterium]